MKYIFPVIFSMGTDTSFLLIIILAQILTQLEVTICDLKESCSIHHILNLVAVFGRHKLTGSYIFKTNTAGILRLLQISTKIILTVRFGVQYLL